MFKEIIDEADYTKLEQTYGYKFPYIIKDNLNELGFAYTLIYAILTLDCSIISGLKFPSELEYKQKILIHICSSENIKGTIDYIYVRPDILRIEIYNKIDYFQIEIHLKNYGFCISKNYYPLISYA